MKPRFALLAMLAIVVLPLSAQGRRNGGGGGGFGAAAMNIDNLATTYKLSSEQKTKTEALIKTFNDVTSKTISWIQSERRAGGASNADSAKKVTDARDAFNASFKALLTEPQAQVFDSLQKTLVGRRRGGGF